MLKEQPALPEIKTEEDAREVYYGINKEYYKKIYKKYKSGQKVSWNWSAFIFNAYWFFSRKMYVIGSLYTLAMGFASVAALQIMDNLTNPKVALMAMPWTIVSIALWVLAGMFGNYIYMAHMEDKIVYPGERNVTKEQMTQLNVMRGGFSVYGIILCALANNIILALIQSLVSVM